MKPPHSLFMITIYVYPNHTHNKA